MRTIINYIRGLFCRHEWERIADRKYYDGADLPYKEVLVWRCKKCGLTQRIRL